MAKTKKSEDHVQRDQLLSLVREKGLWGLSEREIKNSLKLSPATVLAMSQKLEEEGEVKILSFSPLFLLSKDSLEFLCQKIVDYISRFHEKHPSSRGVSVEKLRKRCGSPQKIQKLAMKSLERRGKIKVFENLVALRDFKAALSVHDESLLCKIEEMCSKGELSSVSLEEIQGRLNLTKQRMQELFAHLTERKKIVLSKDGYFIHSQWLESVICQVRGLGRKELTVAEFKQLTGLSRKYAIPLLELLDEIGVTRRKGALREIL